MRMILNSTIRYVVRDAKTREYLGVISNVNSYEEALIIASERFAGRTFKITLSL